MSRPAAYRQSTTSALDRQLAQRKVLYLFAWLSSILAIQIMHLAMDDLPLNFQLSLGSTAGFAFSYFLAQRWRPLTTYIVSALSVLVSVYYLLQLQKDPSMYGNYLGILLGALMVLLAFKAFSPADHRFILMVCVIFLLFSSVASYDLKFMLLLPLFLVCSGCALYIANQIDITLRVSTAAGHSDSPQFRIGWDFASVLLRAVLGIIVLSVAAYIFTPHTSQQNRRLVLDTAPQVNEEDTRSNQVLEADQQGTGNNRNGEAQVGLGDNMDLTDTRRLVADPRPALLLKSHRAGYLRAQVYDVYTGSGWEKSLQLDPRKGRGPSLYTLPEIATELPPHPRKVYLIDFPSRDVAKNLSRRMPVELVNGNVFSANHVEDLQYDVIRQEIKLLEDHPPYYFAMYQPYQLGNISQTRQGNPVDEPMVNMAAIIQPYDLDLVHPKGFTYTVHSLQVRAGSKQLNQVYSSGPPEIAEHYTQLPLTEAPDGLMLDGWGITAEQYRPISQRLRNFARTITDEARLENSADNALSVWDKVQAIYDYLLDNEELTYARQFEFTNPDSEVCEAFLFGTREGYCRHFATAMAVLCRLNDIPARLVTGYSPGTYSLVDNGYVYRASNAHAWVEVYFDGYGWIVFDPTPAGRSAFNRQEATQWVTSILDFLQELFVVDPAGTQQTIMSTLRHLWELAKSHGLATGAVLVILALLVLGIYLLRHMPRRRPCRSITPENEVVAGYLRMCNQLSRLGYVLQHSDTARTYLARAAQQNAGLAGPFREFTASYERAAFSPFSVEDSDVLASNRAVSAVEEWVKQEVKERRKSK